MLIKDMTKNQHAAIIAARDLASEVMFSENEKDAGSEASLKVEEAHENLDWISRQWNEIHPDGKGGTGSAPAMEQT